MQNEDENIKKLIAHAYPNKPSQDELANIGNPRGRVFVQNPQLSDYDGLFEEGAPLPKGYKKTSTALALLGALIVFLALFFGGVYMIVWLAG